MSSLFASPIFYLPAKKVDHNDDELLKKGQILVQDTDDYLIKLKEHCNGNNGVTTEC